MPGMPAIGQRGPQAPFAPLPGGGQPGTAVASGGPPGGMGDSGFLGGGAAFNPQMWAGSGVPNPQNIGKPPGQGGFDVHSLLPPPRPAPAPRAPAASSDSNPFGGGLGGLLANWGMGLAKQFAPQMKSPFAAMPKPGPSPAPIAGTAVGPMPHGGAIT